jgi:hypothetical protein
MAVRLLTSPHVVGEDGATSTEEEGDAGARRLFPEQACASEAVARHTARGASAQ